MKMKNEYLNELDEIIKRAQKDALHEVEKKLWERWNQIDHVLTNGRPIWDQTNGDKSDKMYYLRKRLYLKMKTIYECNAIISSMRIDL